MLVGDYCPRALDPIIEMLEIEEKKKAIAKPVPKPSTEPETEPESKE